MRWSDMHTGAEPSVAIPVRLRECVIQSRTPRIEVSLPPGSALQREMCRHGVGASGLEDVFERVFDVYELVGRGVRIEASEIEAIELGPDARNEVVV